MPHLATFANRGLARGGYDPALSFAGAPLYVLGLNTTNYLLGWKRVPNAAEYEFSLNGGASWASSGTDPFIEVTGRTPNTTDSVRVRARSGPYVSETLSGSVNLPPTGSPSCVVATIGYGKDYSTFQAWENDGANIAGNSNLGTANVILEARAANQEFVNSPVTVEGLTTTPSCYRHVTVGPGCSFLDHEGRRAGNALKYNAALGAGMRYGSVTSLPTVDLREAYSRVSRLQIDSTGNGTSTFGGWGIHTSSSSAPVYVDWCFVISGTDEFVLSANYFAHPITNSIFVNKRPLSASAPKNNSEENNGVVHTNVIFFSAGGTPLVNTVARVAESTFTRTALLGATYLHDAKHGTGTGSPASVGSPVGTGVPVYVDSFTDTAQSINVSGSVVGLPSGVTQISIADCFESSALASLDLRPKAGSPLLAANVTGCW